MNSFLSTMSNHRLTILSIFGSLLVLVFILRLIKHKKIKEEYSLLWIGFSIIFLILSLFRPLLESLANVLGIYYAPSALLLIFVLAQFFILVQFSIVISKLSNNNKNLTQEIALLKAKINNSPINRENFRRPEQE
ncbi:MAG: DUF2304 domain-containing protein [Cellvibrio sp.]|nr:DUF2304 domain-containing protein [Cellvibrio sp.]